MADNENVALDNFLDTVGTPDPGAAAPAEDTNTPENAAPAETGVQDQGQQPAKPQSGYVPIQALDEERGKRKELESQVQKMNDRFQDFMAKLATREQPQTQQQTPQLPDFERQPADYLKARVDEFDAKIAQLTGMTEAQKVAAQINTRVQAAEAEFSKVTPDYMDALAHLRQHRLAELQTFMNPEQAMAALANEEAFVVQNALANGKNPAEVGYAMAKARGYAPKVQAKTPTTEAERLAAIAAGQQANRTLPAGGGEGKTQPMSLEELAQYDGDEFDKLFDKMMSGHRSSVGGMF